MKKCFVLKNLIMNFVNKIREELDLDEIMESNYIIVTFGSFDSIYLSISLKSPLALC